MTFGTTLREHTMAASALFYIAIGYKNKVNMKVAASNITIKIRQMFFEHQILYDHCTAENLRGLDTNLLLNKVQTILVKMTIMLILIFLNNSFFNSFIKTKNEKRTVFRFPFFYKNEKQMRVLKIQNKTRLNMKMVGKINPCTESAI